VRENYLPALAHQGGGQIAEMGYRREAPPMELVDRAEQMVFDISQTRVTGEFEPIGELISESFAELERTMSEGHQAVGCQTGFRDLDNLITGFAPANLVILAARPSMGKTAFALNIARNVAVDQGKGVAVSAWRCRRWNRAPHDVRRGSRGQLARAARYVAGQEWSRLAAACTPLHSAPIFIDDSASVNLMEIRPKLGDSRPNTGIWVSSCRLPAAHDG
jgi:replicative DNA helicase